ncbi:MAG TPA: hypothetical protein VGW77_30705 [Candidatus Binatia bacterium]|jgi:hypothetical protein|nr:hypothetical protein [Candidatus Binatia bacterium]
MQMVALDVRYFGWKQPLIREASFASKPIVQLAGEPHGVVEWTAEEFLRHIK